MDNNIENYLSAALQRLEKAVEEIKKSQPTFLQFAALNVLTEIVKEQTQDENSSSPAR